VSDRIGFRQPTCCRRSCPDPGRFAAPPQGIPHVRSVSGCYLHRLPLDILEVDRSFVADVDQSVELAAMTHAILGIGRSLGLDTVAEGWSG